MQTQLKIFLKVSSWGLILGLSIGEINAQQLRFGWLTDTHVGSEHCAEDLQSVVADLNTQAAMAFVIVSGDITEMDVGENLSVAKNILDQLRMPYYIIPGNHDTKWSDSGGQRFKQLWGEDKFCFTAAGLTFIGFSQGPLLRMADGLIAPGDLRWLKAVLTNKVDRSQPLLFVTHYPPDSSVSNYLQFYRLLEGYNVQGVLSGHLHANKVRQPVNLPLILSRAAKSGRQQPAGYTLVELWGDTLKFFERVPINDFQKLWHIQVLTTQPYRYPQAEPQVLQPATDWKMQWEFDTGNLLTASPVTDSQAIYIGDAGGNFYALDTKTGRCLWHRNFPAPLLATAAVDKQYLVFGATDSNIYCLSKRQGRSIWKVKTAAPVVAVPTIKDGTVYIGASDNTFRAIDLKTGRILWGNKAIEGFVESSPLVLDQLVVFGTWANRLYALDRRGGALSWCWQDGTPGALFAPAACVPVYSAGKIFIVAPDRYLSAIDASSGRTIYRTNWHKVRESLGISATGQMLFARCMQDTVFAFDPGSNHPRYLWEKAAGYGYDFAPAPIIEYAGRLLFGTKNGMIYILDASSGAVLARIPMGKGLIHTICPLSERELVAAIMEGRVACWRRPD